MHDNVRSPLFEVTVESKAGQLRISLAGEMDFSVVEQLRVTVSHIDRLDGRPAVVDLSEMSFCDAAGLSELVNLNKHLKARHPCVTFRGIPQQVHRLMRIAEVDAVFDETQAS